jgi:hypothetical protein
MSQGKARCLYLGRSGLVQSQNAPDWSFIYQVSTVKSPEFNVGDRVVLPDGRVYRYGKAGTGGVLPQMAAAYTKACNAYAVAPTQATLASSGFPAVGTPTVGAVGSQYITYTCASPFGVLGTGVIGEDELRGGHIVIGNGGAQNPQNRGIIGNPALAAAGVHTIRLDAPLVTAVTVGTTGIEVVGNPYLYLVNDGSTQQPYVSWMGVPAVAATVGQYFWLQTWGPCWMTSDGHTCAAAGSREIFIKNNGSVQSGDYFTYAGTAYQRAGFAIDASSTGASTSPIVMLQISC